MSPDLHVGAAPHPGPAFLLLPQQPDRELSTILRKVRLLALRTLLQAQVPASPQAKAALRRVQRVLAPTAKAHGRATLEAVGAPDVLTPLLCFGGGLCGADPLLDAVPVLLLDLARAGVLAEAVLWDRPISSLPDPSAGLRYVSDPPMQGLLASPEGASLRTAAGADLALSGAGLEPADAAAAGVVLRPDYPELRPGLHLALHDTNPLAMVEAHPDKEGNATSLGGHELAAWVRAYEEALAVVDEALPAWGAAVPLALRRIVPVGFEPERHLSASYREGPGMAYFTLHPSALTLAEALVHETQHGRLNALNLLDPVFHNGRTTWTPSPVRPDLRPLMGVLLAVHAFVPVAVMHARLALLDHALARDPAFPRRRAEVLAGNERGLRICEEQAAPSKLGRRLLGELRRLHDWCRDHHAATLPTPDENLLG